MPLDGHAYLVSQGWQGHGKGLRHGAIHRPVIVAQKKTMSGIGKDRDEAFPFWDHVYSAAASAIKVKVYDSDSEDTDDSAPAVTFQRTRTGIISNRRPVLGTPASHSGTTTPSTADGSLQSKKSIMAAAKQEAARRTLYSMFFRGPVLGTDIVEEMLKVKVDEVVSTSQGTSQSATGVEIGVVEQQKDQKRKRTLTDDAEEPPMKRTTKSKKATRKGKEVASPHDEVVEEENSNSGDGVTIEKHKKHTKEKVVQGGEGGGDFGVPDKAERKRLRAEKRARKEERRRRREEKKGATLDGSEGLQVTTANLPVPAADTPDNKRKKKDGERQSKRNRKHEPS